ncbi:MAG: DUF2835 domain-containing protein [Pseudomonadales bacterium]|nr:DUF2835 domain-containing protein [Pseudomonadales bacterium]
MPDKKPNRNAPPALRLRPHVIVDLSINADSIQKLYAGRINGVSALSRDGRRIRFPANILRPFVGFDGVQGVFQLTIDSESRLQEIKRLG